MKFIFLFDNILATAETEIPINNTESTIISTDVSTITLQTVSLTNQSKSKISLCNSSFDS